MPRPTALASALLATALLATAAHAQRRTENVVLVTLDGLRWQEVFAGADNGLMNKDVGGVRDLLRARRLWWRGDAEKRRELLMPFLWGDLVAHGQLFGDPDSGCRATVANGLNFSYPGYHELLVGFADAQIDSNAKRPNPNVTVLEWLSVQEEVDGKVAAFTCWDVFPFIINSKRSGVPVNAGWDPITEGVDPARLRALQELSDALPRYWDDTVRYDAPTFYGAIEYLKKHKPRVFYIGLGETDDWAHSRRYDLYLQMAQRSDAFLRELWDTLQGMPEYRDKTALVVTTDHGRGDGARWTDHGKDVPGAERIWISVRGPDTEALGVRRDVEVGQAQVAATLAALLGLDYAASDERIAPSLPGVVRNRR